MPKSEGQLRIRSVATEDGPRVQARSTVPAIQPGRPRNLPPRLLAQVGLASNRPGELAAWPLWGALQAPRRAETCARSGDSRGPECPPAFHGLVEACVSRLRVVLGPRGGSLVGEEETYVSCELLRPPVDDRRENIRDEMIPFLIPNDPPNSGLIASSGNRARGSALGIKSRPVEGNERVPGGSWGA